MKERIRRILDLESLFKNVEGLVETRIQLLKLELKEEVTQRLKIGILWVVLSLFIILAFFCMNFALGWWLGTVFNSIAVGFLIVGAVYFLLALLTFLYLRHSPRTKQTTQDSIHSRHVEEPRSQE